MTDQQTYLSELSDKIANAASQIRYKNMDWGRRVYALDMLQAVWQSKLAGYDQITVIELGVANGHGLRSLCDASAWYQEQFDIGISVVGFDSGQGLYSPIDYRDHPEMWDSGDYAGSEQRIREWLPKNADLIIGDVKDTIPAFVGKFTDSAPLAFVSLDLDYYSSTVSCFPLFEMPAKNYLPAMPVHVDDAHNIITYSPWTGVSLAINEFNDTHNMRKFEYKEPHWRIDNFYVFHVLDHPFRTGEIKPPHRIDCVPL